MISKDQANAAADGLLGQARAERASPPRSRSRDAFGRYRELELFEPAQRCRRLREAMAWADRQWPVVLACFLWLSCAIGASVFLLPESWHAAPAALIVTLAVPFFLVRRAYVRRKLVALSQARQGDERGPGAAPAAHA